jgi:hypothetical protein
MTYFQNVKNLLVILVMGWAALYFCRTGVKGIITGEIRYNSTSAYQKDQSPVRFWLLILKAWGFAIFLAVIAIMMTIDALDELKQESVVSLDLVPDPPRAKTGSIP